MTLCLKSDTELYGLDDCQIPDKKLKSTFSKSCADL